MTKPREKTREELTAEMEDGKKKFLGLSRLAAGGGVWYHETKQSADRQGR